MPVRVGTGVVPAGAFVGAAVAASGTFDGTALRCGLGSSRPPDGTGSCGSATTMVGKPVRCGNTASSTYATASTTKLLPSTEIAQRRGGMRSAAGNHATGDVRPSLSTKTRV